MRQRVWIQYFELSIASIFCLSLSEFPNDLFCYRAFVQGPQIFEQASCLHPVERVLQLAGRFIHENRLHLNGHTDINPCIFKFNAFQVLSLRNDSTFYSITFEVLI